MSRIARSVILSAMVFGLTAASIEAEERPIAASTDHASMSDGETTVAQAAAPAAKPTASATPAGAQEPTSAAAVPPIPADLIKAGTLSAKYADYVPKGWEFSFPSVGDSMFGETFGLRESLAKHHIGFSFFSLTDFSYNLREAPMAGYQLPNHQWTEQVYNGQRPSVYSANIGFLTYSIPSKNMQFVVRVVDFSPSWVQLSPGSTRLDDLYLHWELLKSRLKLDIGWQENDCRYYDGYIAGNLAAGTLGMSAVLPYEIGQNRSDETSPAFNVKYNITKHFYEKAGIQRSTDPTSAVVNDTRDSTGFRFLMRGTKALLIDEIGYKRDSAPDKKSIFVRGDGWFNTTGYTDLRSLEAVFASKKTSNNFAVSLAGDKQLTQPNKFLPFQGWYAGGSVQYVPPQQNLYTAYYEVRAYTIGPFRRRPTDMATMVLNHIDFSQSALTTLTQLCTVANICELYNPAAYTLKQPAGTMPYYGDQTNLAVNYGLHIRPGLWLTPTIEYTRHPVSAPRLHNPVWAQVNLSMYF